MRKKIFTKQQTEDMIDKYNKGFSLAKIAKTYNCSRQVVSKWLSDKINKRPNNRLYTLNESYFQNIDNADKAYWIGFIAADGCIHFDARGVGTLLIRSTPKDKKHLQNFLDDINSTSKIKTGINSGFGEGKPYCKIDIYSTRICNDLLKYGIKPKKSLVLQPPTNIPEKYLVDWIRGLLDGDGSFYETSRKLFCLRFMGTKEVIEWIHSYLHFDTKISKEKRCKNLYYIRITGLQKTYALARKLYYDENIRCLERKYKTFILLKSRLGE